MSTTRTLVLCVPVLLAVAGCAVVAGVDFGKAHDRADEGGTTAQEEDGGGVVETPDATPAGCTADQKTCGGACVSKNDPAYGCAGSDCLPCSIPFAQNAICKAGVCGADTCAAAHADCDGDPKNGCEASLSSPLTCGNCTTKCNAAAPLCAPAGCVLTCPATLTECNGSCIDTKSDPDNCGQCGRKCAAPANGDPACLNSTCVFACRSGFGDCVDNPAKACTPLPKFYRDMDGDGVGGATSVQGCAPPPGHVAAGGDCLDTNSDVFPGQTKYFGAPFTNAAGVASFDYDCSGVEVDATEHWPGNCGPGCDLTGHVPAVPARAGAGINAYCGSTSSRYCVSTGPLPYRSIQLASRPAPQLGSCQQRSSNTPPVGCH